MYFIGHLHQSLNINEVNVTLEDVIDSNRKLTNIEIVESAGCTKDEYTFYAVVKISKNSKFERRKLKYDRDKFINKIMNTEFLDKINILKYFYGI